MKKPTIMYLCDGAVEGCTHCWKTGGGCHHTSDINHAVNFKRRHPKSEVWWEGELPPRVDRTDKACAELVTDLDSILDDLP